MSTKSQKQTTTSAKQTITALSALLAQRPDQSPQLLDITDVLRQVYQKLDTAKNPEALINRLVNYIRIKASNGKITFPTPQENLIDELAWIGAKAGFNGQYMADFSDKRQFYSFLEKMPVRD
ncbi:bacteriocin immunity protein [Lacticaseibacillus sp. GG6-2]